MPIPWVSVVMPTFNGEAYLEQALESICAQGDPAIEVIAVDDGSDDATCRLLERYRARLPLRIERTDHRGNWVASVNRGLEIGRGEFACILHQDDLWSRGRLDTLRRLVGEHPDGTLYVHPADYIDHYGHRIGTLNCPLSGAGSLLQPRVAVERLLVQNFIAIPAPLFRREAALGCGGLDEDLWYTADWDLWLKLAAMGRTVYYPCPLASFRVHPGSQTLTRCEDSDALRDQLALVFERHSRVYERSYPLDPSVRDAALLAIELNVFLSDRYHGRGVSPRRLVALALRLRPAGWRRFLHDSRIVARVAARLRAGLSRTGPDRCPPGPSGVSPSGGVSAHGGLGPTP